MVPIRMSTVGLVGKLAYIAQYRFKSIEEEIVGGRLTRHSSSERLNSFGIGIWSEHL